MKPKLSEPQSKEIKTSKIELVSLVKEDHELVQIAQEINWERFEKKFGESYGDKGRPGISTRLMVALQYLKYAFDLSDEAVVMGWVENPYWQYLSGMIYFEHEMPIDPSSMSNWRKRIGIEGVEELLKETIQVGLSLKIIKPSELKRVNVDTTVQEKDIRFPTDSRLYDRMREHLVKQAQAEGISLRQSYIRVSKQQLLKQHRYAHAKQFKRAAKCTRKLKTYLGRTIRDIQRKAAELSGPMQALLELAQRLYQQQRNDKNKLYSIHAPEVECISKGKAHKRYEFGCKVGVSATSKGAWVVGIQAFHGNPYDGHTLSKSLGQVARISPVETEQVYVDGAYKGHDYQGSAQVHVAKRGKKLKASLKRWLKRRAAIEPTIGHLKQDKRLNRNRLKGELGDSLNALLSGAGYNFRKLLKALRALLLFLFKLLHLKALRRLLLPQTVLAF